MSPASLPVARPSLSSFDLCSPRESNLPLTPPLTPSATDSAQLEHLPACSATIENSASDSCPNASPYFKPGHPLVRKQIQSILPSPDTPTFPTISPAFSGQDLDTNLDTTPPTRFLLVKGIPRFITSQVLKQTFAECGNPKDILFSPQEEHGVLILAFYDLRHSLDAYSELTSRTFFENVRLLPCFISLYDLRQLLGQANFVSAKEGHLFISTSSAGHDDQLSTTTLRGVLSSFGALRSFGVMDTSAKTFHAEYVDARDASAALSSLNGRIVLGVRLHLTLHDPEGIDTEDLSSLSAQSSTPTQASASASSIPFPRSDPPANSDSLEPTATPCAPLYARGARRASTPGPFPTQHVRVRRISNIYNFDKVGKMELPPAPPRPRSISVSSDTGSPVAGRLALSPLPMSLPLPPSEDIESPEKQPGLRLHSDAVQDIEEPRVQSTPYAYVPQRYFMGGVAEPRPHLQLQMADAWPIPSSGLGLQFESESAMMATPVAERLQDQNRVDADRIESGEDRRTTVMIKNIPNQMSDRHLISYINEVCPRAIDFLYLRMDFTNGCNVGYAFVNFIRVEDLLRFVKSKLGTRWNIFCSEKVLRLSYARYQGKDALIEKFRSSSVMAQRESWRPKIFYSSGPKQGLPEEFPSPSQALRKEYSKKPANLTHQTLFHQPANHHQRYM